jgi:CBS domain-containing protein
MTNRKLALIVKEQKPVRLGREATVQQACRLMWERAVGSVLVADAGDRLAGIFTGRDAVRLLARGGDPATTTLGEAMTADPVTVTVGERAIDALRLMGQGGFRHLPVVEGGRIRGIVSRGDFKGDEIELIDHEEHLREVLW